VENEVRAAARMAEAEASGIMLARDLANDPANVTTPSAFADKARGVAAKYGMDFRVLGRAELEAEKMEAYLAVARGSAEEPKMAVIEYTPKGAEGREYRVQAHEYSFSAGDAWPRGRETWGGPIRCAAKRRQRGCETGEPCRASAALQVHLLCYES
jgi:hypothetical protein